MDEPFDGGFLPVGDGNEIFWECWGNPAGKPALFLHGGPGSGIHTHHRGYFDPSVYCLVSLDQRGCGRSRPLVTDPSADLSANTTQALIRDLETLREHVGVRAWLVAGLSWGSTLALAYAEAHPGRVTELVLGAVTTTSRSEVDWITEDLRRIFPREWEEFAAGSGFRPGQRIIDAYYERITDSDSRVREAAARAWCRWEDVHVSFDPAHTPDPRFRDPQLCLLFATLVIHYWRHAAFLGAPGIAGALPRIAHLPAVLVHGRLDISSPLSVPWDLHKAWPASRLVLVEGEGHFGTGIRAAVARAIAGFADRRDSSGGPQ